MKPQNISNRDERRMGVGIPGEMIVCVLDAWWCQLAELGPIQMHPSAALAYARYLGEIEEDDKLACCDDLSQLSYRGQPISINGFNTVAIVGAGKLRDGTDVLVQFDVSMEMMRIIPPTPTGETFVNTTDSPTGRGAPDPAAANQEAAPMTTTASKPADCSAEMETLPERYAWFNADQLCDFGAQLKIDLPLGSGLDHLEQALRTDVDSIAGVMQFVSENGWTNSKGSPVGHIQFYDPAQLFFIASRILNLLDYDDVDYLDVRAARLLAHASAEWCLWCIQNGPTGLSVPNPEETPTGP